MNKKKIITDVLFNFYNTNLASEAAREWIADEIIKKLDNPEHEIRDVLQSEPIKKGHFEEYLSNGGPSVEIEAALIIKQESKVWDCALFSIRDITPP